MSLWGTPSSTPSSFGTPSSAPAFGTPSTPSFATPAFGIPSTPFSTPSLFSSPFSQQTPAAAPTPSFGFPNAASQITTQMAPVAPLAPPLVDRDVMAIVDAYKDEPGNLKYSFRHLLFSVTDPAARVKPLGVSDIMWSEAMGKLEGMESADRERLWPQLVHSFKDLSQRLKLQDEVLVSDADRLKKTQANVKLLQRHCQSDTIPWIERMKQKEQSLQRRLLRVMRIVEALEGRGLRVPLMKGEAELNEKLTSVTKQLKGPGNGLSARVNNLLSISRMRANAGAVGSGVYLPGSTKIDEQSLTELQAVTVCKTHSWVDVDRLVSLTRVALLNQVLQQQTEAIAKLGSVLKRDTRDVEIIMSEDTDMVDGDN